MLAVGEKAPAFTAAGTEGVVDLSRLLQLGPTVLYFFPRAMTPG
jgi:peroxiredoxin